jgi:PAS domain S-box-containing protein
LTEQKRVADELDQQVAQRTAELAAAEERWRSVFENSAIGVALSDLNCRILAANPVYEEMVGYTEEELQKLSFLDITHEEDIEPNRKLVGELIAGKRQQFQIEKQYRCKNGSLMWVRNNVSVVPGTERVPRFLMALSEDITTRKRAEKKLRRSEALLAEVERISLTGGFSWRVDTTDVTFSEEAYRIFEFEKDAPVTLEQIAGRVHPEDIPLLSEKIQVARGGGGDQDYEIRLRMPDGSVKYLRTISHAMRDMAGRIEIIGAAQDITRRRVSEEALAKARSELAHVASVTSLATLTASIAHEVNQPLSGIVTNASTCLRMLTLDPPNVDGARETARRTIRDGNRASDVITRLRALFSKKHTIAERVDLNEAAREVIALSLSELQRNRVILRCELADDLPLVTGDRVQLQQVILNLVRNASDAMNTVHDRPRELLIRTERDEGDQAVLSVRDAGLGFDPQTADRLFETFYTTKHEGMGVGLYVSRSIVESHQGRLWATLNDGPGATFSFSIPRGPGGATGADSNRDMRAPAVADADVA